MSSKAEFDAYVKKLEAQRIADRFADDEICEPSGVEVALKYGSAAILVAGSGLGTIILVFLAYQAVFS